MILTLDGPQAHDDASSNAGIRVTTRAGPTRVPDDWDNDDEEEEETDSQKIWETAYAPLP